MKGPDAQDFAAVTLDEWTWHSDALDSEEVAIRYQSRLGGVGTWINVTDDVRALEVNLGRQDELGRIEAAEGTTTINDLAREYDPANTLSPRYPNVRPLRRLRAHLTTSSSNVPVGHMYVEGGRTAPTFRLSLICSCRSPTGSVCWHWPGSRGRSRPV